MRWVSSPNKMYSLKVHFLLPITTRTAVLHFFRHYSKLRQVVAWEPFLGLPWWDMIALGVVAGIADTVVGIVAVDRQSPSAPLAETWASQVGSVPGQERE